MIPVRLNLINFMSYKEMEEPLDFSSIHTACLTGANGQGKSTLLDAMTWAIWGKARARRSDDLVRLGAEEAQVEFEFHLGHELYRIIRSRNIKGRGKSSLEFQIFDESQGKFKSITERNIRKTQEKITNTLRMDYDTFTNSAFILQGKADSFTLKTPSNRKEVLAEILNLKVYDILEKKARKMRRKAEVQIQVLSKSIKEIDKELSHKKEYERDHRRHESELKKIKQSLKQYENKLEKHRKTVNELSQKSTELEAIQKQIKSTNNDITNLSADINLLQKKIKDYENILANKEQIEKKYEELIKCQKEEEDFSEKEKKHRDLLEEKRKLEQQVQEVKHELEKEINELENRIQNQNEKISEAKAVIQKREEIEKGFKELEATKAKEQELKQQQETLYDLENEKHALEKEIEHKRHEVLLEKGKAEDKLADINGELEKTEDTEKERKKLQKKLEELEKTEKKLLEIKEEGGTLRVQKEHLEKRNDAIDEELEELHEKLHLITQSDSATCPLCKTELSEDQQSDITEKYKKEQEEKEKEKKENNKKIKELDKEIKAKIKEYKKLEKSLPERDNVQKRLAELDMTDQKQERLLAEKPKVEKEIVKYEKILKDKSFAKAEIQKLEEINKKIKDLSYSREDYNKTREKLEELGKYNTLNAQLNAALDEYDEIQKHLPKLKEELKAMQKKLDDGDYAPKLKKDIEQHEKELKALDYDEHAHGNLKRRIKKLNDYQIQKVKLDQADKLLGESQEQLSKVELNLEKKRSERGKLLAQSEKLEAEVKDLPKMKVEIKEFEKKLISLRRDEAMNRTSLGRTEERLEYCSKLEKEKKEKESVLKEEKEKKSLYLDLTYAFSKKGIQAFIIENAIPDIELEANRILSKISDNKMSVKFETQKEKRDGNAAETLDITISDELGTRPYEVFSGGEAFRINFSIRLALSKLLAKRAGAKLQTLVIDEGFGTQDSTGKDRLVEILNAISDEFAKILVITHLEDMQDMFPARIEVTKTEIEGSKVILV